MNGERVIPHGQVGLRGCLPYGRQAGHGHGETVGEQVQGGVVCVQLVVAGLVTMIFRV